MPIATSTANGGLGAPVSTATNSEHCEIASQRRPERRLLVHNAERDHQRWEQIVVKCAHRVRVQHTQRFVVVRTVEGAPSMRHVVAQRLHAGGKAAYNGMFTREVRTAMNTSTRYRL